MMLGGGFIGDLGLNTLVCGGPTQVAWRSDG